MSNPKILRLGGSFAPPINLPAAVAALEDVTPAADRLLGFDAGEEGKAYAPDEARTLLGVPTAAALADETTARQTGDSTNAAAIANETTARQSAVGNRVRFDADQTTTATQRALARKNVGLPEVVAWASDLFFGDSANDSSVDPALTTAPGADRLTGLQAAVDAARDAGRRLTLVIDRPCKLSGPLRYDDRVRIVLDGPAAGLTLADAAHSPLLLPRSPTTQTNSFILEGDGTIHGNYLNQNRLNPAWMPWRVAGSPGGSEPLWSLVVGGVVSRCRRVVIRGVQVLGTRTYGMHLLRSGEVTVADVRYDYLSQSAIQNTDGLHIHGYDKLTVRNFSGRGGDDVISLLSDDGGYDGNAAGDPDTNNPGYPSYVVPAATGPTDLADIYLQNSPFGMRLLSAGTPFGPVSVRGVTGTLTGGSLLLASSFPDASVGIVAPGPGLFSSLRVEDVRVTHTGLGPYARGLIHAAGGFDDLTISGVRRTGTETWPVLYGHGLQARAVTISDCRDEAPGEAPLVKLQGGSYPDLVTRLRFRGCDTAGRFLHLAGSAATVPNVYAWDSVHRPTAAGKVLIQNDGGSLGRYDIFRTPSSANSVAGGTAVVDSGSVYDLILDTEPAATTLNTGLKAVYRLDETSGSFANAFTGSGAAAALTRRGTPGVGGVGAAGVLYHLRPMPGGGDAYLSADGGALAGGSAFTFVVWVKFFSNAVGNEVIAWRTDGTTGVDWLLYVPTGTGLVTFFRNGQSAGSAGGLVVGAWRLVAVTVTGGAYRLTVGDPRTGAVTGAAGAGSAGDRPVIIGGNASGGERATAGLSHAGFWSRALTVDELTFLWESGTGKLVANPGSATPFA